MKCFQVIKDGPLSMIGLVSGTRKITKKRFQMTFHLPFSTQEQKSTLRKMLRGKSHCDDAKIHLSGQGFWKPWFVTISNILCFSTEGGVLFLRCAGKPKTHKPLRQYNIYTNYKINWIPKAVLRQSFWIMQSRNQNSLHANRRCCQFQHKASVRLFVS